MTLIALAVVINLGIVHLLSRKYDYVGSLLFLINLGFAVV